MERRRRLSYANVASTLALVVALSGTAYAAATVTSADIVNRTIKVKDISTGAVFGLLPDGAYAYKDDAGAFSGSSMQVVATVDVPDDANVAVLAKMRINNVGGSDAAVNCVLAGGDSFDVNWVSVAGGGAAGFMANMTFELVEFFDSSEGVTISCNPNGGSIHVFDLKITAFETGGVSKTAL
jgi:hypothetical protein